MDEHCARCGTNARHLHRAVDEHGSVPICGLCISVLVGELNRTELVLTLVLNQPLVSRAAS